MKSVLISIQPKWCELIANGKKTIEVRKTKPKLETPFKCYIYCTNGSPYLNRHNNRLYLEPKDTLGGRGYGTYERLSGKVIGEFVCDWTCDWYPHHIITLFGNKDGYFIFEDDLKASCLTYEKIASYGNGKTIYGWHISNLVIYDKPRELYKFYRECERPDCDGDCPYFHFENTPNSYEGWCECDEKISIKRPPQSWCYCESEVDTE